MKWQKVEDTVWPVDVGTDDEDSLEWRLRYAPRSITRQDMLAAASVLSAYTHLGAGMFPRDGLRRVRAAHRAARGDV